MKVLFVINQLFKGGAETALVNLLSAMPPENYQVDLLLYDQIDIPNTVTLISKIPSYVNVYNIAENEKKLAYIKKGIFKAYHSLTGRTAFRKKAYRVLKENEYDTAISFGEWFSCSLVAKYARARRKYVWIHADADKADFFHPDICRYNRIFDGFIFVSGISKLSAESHYPFLKNRSYVINNIINRDEVIEKSNQPLPFPLPAENLPRLVTVANIRPEKNHLRQVRVMKKLFDRGLRFYWINVGSRANRALSDEIESLIRRFGLQDYCIFTGAVENPYPAIKNSDAVCVLSDHESWSMVITEAKTVGTPVIATKTSGALEQIVHGETGILCDFDDDSIADKIEEFLTNSGIREKIRSNLIGFSSTANALRSLELLLTAKKKLLYVFDDINYMSGARAATLLQADYLRSFVQTDIFSVTAPNDSELASKYRVTDIESCKDFRCLTIPIREILSGKEYSLKQKCLRIAFAISVRLGLDAPLYQKLLKKELYYAFNSYDFVITVSEASRLRHFVATLPHPQKIQWIHTDYTAWRNYSGWTRKFTSNDWKTYKKIDTIVCLSDTLCDKFTSLYPHLRDKTVSIPNLIDYKNILKNSTFNSDIKTDKSKLNLITVGRMEDEKRYDRIILVAKELKAKGVDFAWYLVGDGSLLKKIKAMSSDLGLDGHVIFTGYLSNICPLLIQCNLFVLMSEYEGTPVTVDEAKVLGVPILAKNAGGIRDQVAECDGTVLDSVSADDIINFNYSAFKKMQPQDFENRNKIIVDKLNAILESE